MDENNPVFKQVCRMATNINGQTEVTRDQLKKLGKEAQLIGRVNKAVSAVQLTLGTCSDNSMGGTIFEITDTLYKNLENLTDKARTARKDIDAVTSALIDQLLEKETLEDLQSLLHKKLVEQVALKATFDSLWNKVKTTFTGEISTIKSRLTQVENGSLSFPAPTLNAAIPLHHVEIRV